jgi:hypothetical protein
MKCFEHPEENAVGVCKHCQKGLCSTCAHDLGHGLACKGKHEKQVAMLNALIEKNAEVYKAAPINILIAPIFYAFMGLIFVIFGYGYRGGISSFTCILGIGFIIFAIVMYVRNRRLFGQTKKDF